MSLPHWLARLHAQAIASLFFQLFQFSVHGFHHYLALLVWGRPRSIHTQAQLRQNLIIRDGKSNNRYKKQGFTSDDHRVGPRTQGYPESWARSHCTTGHLIDPTFIRISNIIGRYNSESSASFRIPLEDSSTENSNLILVEVGRFVKYESYFSNSLMRLSTMTCFCIDGWMQ